MENLTHIWPFFIVTNIKASVEFYVNKLGFQVRYIGPDGDPYWAIVGRDNISIMLKAIVPGVKPVPNHQRHQWARWDAYISAINPGILFEEYSALEVPFTQPLGVNSDRLYGFEALDPDGYILFFGRPE